LHKQLPAKTLQYGGRKDDLLVAVRGLPPQLQKKKKNHFKENNHQWDIHV
jgi:hypothetical protein